MDGVTMIQERSREFADTASQEEGTVPEASGQAGTSKLAMTDVIPLL